jgi:hypothetical protein
MNHHDAEEGPYYLQITSLQGRVKFQDVYASARRIQNATSCFFGSLPKSVFFGVERRDWKDVMTRTEHEKIACQRFVLRITTLTFRLRAGGGLGTITSTPWCNRDEWTEPPTT